MIAASGITESIALLLSPSRLTGPIFDKELRISSRRKRNYLLRSAYVSLLAVFVAAVWLDQVPSNILVVYYTSRMAEAGKEIVRIIVWFQFYAIQFLAVVMLSTAINDEVYRRTLNTLMTTPITSLQIVLGKLVSKLFQLILLVAISLPLLAIIRIFGGVPWDYVRSSICITLTAVLFAGSVSLLFSILCRRAYVAIILTVLTYGILFGLIWFLLTRSLGLSLSGRQVSAPATMLLHLNPYQMLALNTRTFMNPGLAGRVNVSLFSHCAIMLAASAAVLFASVRLVRKIALAQSIGGAGVLGRLWRARPARSATKAVQVESAGRIRHVTGPPVLWKELISRRSSREKLFVMTIIAVELIMIAAMYLFPYVARASGMEEAHALYVGIFIGLGSLSVVVFPATSITSEKEARSWPLLLTTTVSDWDIVLGKSVGVLRRSLPAWIMLVVYLVPYWGILPFGLFDVVVLVIGTTILLCGTGLYVSSRLTRTSSAVAANFVLAASVWGILHSVLALYERSFRHVYRRSFIERFWDTVPFVEAMQTVWSRRYYRSGEATVYVLGYVLLGIIFAWRAKCRFRRDVFQQVL